MFDRVCLVSYHEIGLKGHNRASFERRLLDNVKAALVPFHDCEATRIQGHIVVSVGHEADLMRVANTIAACPGVVKVACAWRLDRETEDIFHAAELALMDCGDFQTFKVKSKRSNTDYPIHSMDLNAMVGEHLCGFAPDKKVRMEDPDVTVYINISQGKAFVYSRTVEGVGGLPVGSSGKVVSLLSAGIDSPVATWRMLHRGAIAICVHFSGRPQTGDESEHLVREIIAALAPSAGIGRLYVIPFGDYQRQISLSCPPKLRVIMYRRLMFSVAQAIARREGAGALVTGESLGQVASQTLPNIQATDDVCELPVFRPLIGNDKQEIMDMAQKLGTFPISIRNHDDCCTLFMPREPETSAHMPEVRAAWEALPVDEWVAAIMRDVEYEDFPCPAYHPKHAPSPSSVDQPSSDQRRS